MVAVQDGLGSVRIEAGSAAAILGTQTPDPYGVHFGAQGTVSLPFAFTGEMRDANGLQYHRARYLRPALGVFASLDPHECGANASIGANGYNYADGNPVIRSDPSGKCWINPGSALWQQEQCLGAFVEYVSGLNLDDATVRHLAQEEHNFWGNLPYPEFVMLWNNNFLLPPRRSNPENRLEEGAAVALGASAFAGLTPDDIFWLGAALCLYALAQAVRSEVVALPARQPFFFQHEEVEEEDDEVVRPIPIPDNPTRNCGSVYPNLVRCNSLPHEYVYSSAQQALNSLKQVYGNNRLQLHNPRPAASGPCPRTGTHYNVRYQGSRYGSINCCPCCLETPTGPLSRTLCRVI
jgi:RHS repeat-associated protein